MSGSRIAYYMLRYRERRRSRTLCVGRRLRVLSRLQNLMPLTHANFCSIYFILFYMCERHKRSVNRFRQKTPIIDTV